jgi:hypothetical protein
MLKRLLFLSFVTMTTQLFAQITITSADSLRSGQCFVYAVMDTVVAANLAIGTPGTNRTWNFSTLRRQVGIPDYTTCFNKVNASMPGAAYFPTATHADPYQGGVIYYQITNTMMAYLGNGDLSGAHQRNGKPQREITYPMAYGTAFRDTFKRYITGNPIDSSVSNHIITTADAWGSITTPLGTFNAIRTTTVHDFIRLGDSGKVTTQSWWVNGYARPIVQRHVAFNAFAGISIGASGSYLVRRTVATEDFGATVANAYPNPTMKGINLDFSVEKAQQISFQVTNLIGQTVVSEQPNFFAQGSHTQYIALDGLANGLYMLNVLNEKNEIISAKKIMMQR